MIFSGAGLISEIALNFRETKASYYSLNFKKNFAVKIFYYKYDYPSAGENMPGGNVVIVGYIEGTKEERPLTVLESNFRKFLKNDETKENSIYYYVWYNKNIDVIYLKTNETGFFNYNGLCLLIMWILSVPAIISLIKTKRKNKQNNK